MTITLLRYLTTRDRKTQRDSNWAKLYLKKLHSRRRLTSFFIFWHTNTHKFKSKHTYPSMIHLYKFAHASSCMMHHQRLSPACHLLRHLHQPASSVAPLFFPHHITFEFTFKQIFFPTHVSQLSSTPLKRSPLQASRTVNYACFKTRKNFLLSIDNFLKNQKQKQNRLCRIESKRYFTTETEGEGERAAIYVDRHQNKHKLKQQARKGAHILHPQSN